MQVVIVVNHPNGNFLTYFPRVCTSLKNFAMWTICQFVNDVDMFKCMGHPKKLWGGGHNHFLSGICKGGNKDSNLKSTNQIHIP